MQVHKTSLDGVLVVKPEIYKDSRGFFQETYHQSKYEEFGIPANFVQDNRSFSVAGVVRGLHFQNPSPQGKLVSVSMGSIFDVAVDIRAGSPTFGTWHGETLTGENGFQLWVPAGFAHGFMALEDSSVSYKVTAFYDPMGDGCIHWRCPRIAIEWPDLAPILSAKDERAPFLDAVAMSRLQF